MKKNKIILFILTFLMICINTISFSKYQNSNIYSVWTNIAHPIIRVTNDETIAMSISENNMPNEYYFYIENYEGDEINEVEFEYTIELEQSVENFPITYTLIDCDTNEEIKLNNGVSEKLKIKSNEKEKRNFKIISGWRELSTELDEKLQLKVKINIVQMKEE